MTEAVIVSLTMLLCFLSWLESPQSMLIETWICAEVKKTPFLSLIFYSYCTFLLSITGKRCDGNDLCLKGLQAYP